MTITAEQVKERKAYIGGSDVAGMLGLSRWTTPLQIWAIKTQAIEPPDQPTLQKTLGIMLEEVVAELFTQKTGKVVHRVNETKFHKQYPFLGANIDRRVVGEDAILEVKTASAWKAKEWSDEEIPKEYILQVVHYLAVTGASRGYLAVLIGNQDFQIKIIERDDKMIADLIRKEVDFWQSYVVPKVMPGLGMITSKDAETLYSLYPIADPGSVVALDDKANQLVEFRNSTIQALKLLEGDIDRTENELKAMMGDKEIGQTEQWTVTWKNQSTRRLDTGLLKVEKPDLYESYLHETKSRVLRIKGAKV
jgi:putative phage-type endonuclease